VGASPDTSFLYLSQEDVVAAGGTDMPAVIDVIERAFRVKADGAVSMPPKVMITWSDEPGTEELHGRIMAMPAYVGGEFDVAGIKWIPASRPILPAVCPGPTRWCSCPTARRACRWRSWTARWSAPCAPGR
jgi:hypothetical protein